MNGGVSKARTRRSRVKLSKALQEKLLDAVANTSADHSPSPREQSQVSRHLARNAVPAQSTKRQLEFEIDPLPAKRARLHLTDTQRPGVEDEKAEQADKIILQQPKPKPPTRTYASFLRDFVDPAHSSPRPESIHTFVSEWLESVGSDREEHCRSDSHLHCSDDGPVARKLTRSAPEMSYTRDADGFMVPRTPVSTGSRSYRADAESIAPSDFTGATTGSGRLSAKSLVEDPLYRSMNLAANGIYLRDIHEEFPDDVANLVHEVGMDRDSPGPSPDQVWHDADLRQLEMGAGEPDVEEYFRNNVYPYPKSTESLKRSDRQPMSKYAVPQTASQLRVSNPVPDMLYGYSRSAFPQQQAQLISMGTETVANNQDLIYPFFVIEFKGDGPTGVGSLWVATNQCLGGSASCVNIAERLNNQLRHCKSDKIRSIHSAAFSVAMSGTEARLYISWKHNELDYYTRKIDSFLLQKPNDYLEFRKWVLNIIDWGKDRRLKEIGDSLDILLEESRLRASKAAKSHQPSSDGSATSSGKRRKSSSTCRNSSKSKSTPQSEGNGATNSYWEWDNTFERHFHRNGDGTLSWSEQ